VNPAGVKVITFWEGFRRPTHSGVISAMSQTAEPPTCYALTESPWKTTLLPYNHKNKT
jgi:hypothetical protein